MSQEQSPLFKPLGPKARIVSLSSEAREPYKDTPDSVAARLLKYQTDIHFFTDRPDRVFDPNSLAGYINLMLGPRFTVLNHGDVVNFALLERQVARPAAIEPLAKASLARTRSLFLSTEQKVRLEGVILDQDPAIPLREITAAQVLEEGFRHQPLYHSHLYEISQLGNAYRFLIPQEFIGFSNSKRNVTVVISGRGLGQREGEGIHLRGGFTYGGLAVVSTTGLVEAPGAPLEVIQSRKWGYINTKDDQRRDQFEKELAARGNLLHGGILEEILTKVYANQMLDYEDPRLNEAIKGITLSMILFALGEYGRVSQCSTSDLARRMPDLSWFCRLHDAHWQEELIATQIKEPNQPEFCDYHQEIFGKLHPETSA